jgi:hypothetical protein
MRRKLKIFFFVFIFVPIVFYLTHALPEVSSNTNNRGRIKYRKIFEETLPGEEIFSEYWEVNRLLVRAFDLKHKNSKNGIVVAGRKLYIFTANGTLLFKTSKNFDWDLQQMSIAKLSKDGYYDTIIISQHYCWPIFLIFDWSGFHLSTIGDTELQFYIRDMPTFFLKDLDSDGADEVIIHHKAFYTKDRGNTWGLLWQIDEFSELELILGSEFERENGLCGIYTSPVWLRGKMGDKQDIVAISGAGKELFRTTIGHLSNRMQLTTGDLDGDGIKNEVAAVGDNNNSKIYILDRDGKVVNVIPMAIGNGIPFSASKIICGKLIGNSNVDEIVVGGFQGIIVYDTKGNKLWDFDAKEGYDIWEGEGSYMQGIYHLFISDLDSDGKAELITGVADKILVFSNRGELIDEMTVDGIIKGYATHGVCDNPSMDIADINNDGFQEIIAVTTKGKIYIFGLKDREVKVD